MFVNALHHMHERARAQEADPDKTQNKLTNQYFSSVPTRSFPRCTLPVPTEAHVPQVAYSAHQTKMLEELYFEGKLESREGRAAAVVSVSGLSTPDGLVVGRLVTIGTPLPCISLPVAVCPSASVPLPLRCLASSDSLPLSVPCPPLVHFRPADIVNWRHNYIKFLKANAKADQA